MNPLSITALQPCADPIKQKKSAGEERKNYIHGIALRAGMDADRDKNCETKRDGVASN
jgi:hypothetical protein